MDPEQTGRSRDRARTDRSPPRAPLPRRLLVTTWPGPVSSGRAARAAPRGDPRTQPQRLPGIREGIRAGDPFRGRDRRGGGKTRPWPRPDPRPRRGVAPPLVAAARLGAKRSGSEATPVLSGPGLDLVPAAAPRAAGLRAHPRGRTLYLRAPSARRAALSRANTRNANRAAEPLWPRSDAVGRNVPKLQAGGAPAPAVATGPGTTARARKRNSSHPQ